LRTGLLQVCLTISRWGPTCTAATGSTSRVGCASWF